MSKVHDSLHAIPGSALGLSGEKEQEENTVERLRLLHEAELQHTIDGIKNGPAGRQSRKAVTTKTNSPAPTRDAGTRHKEEQLRTGIQRMQSEARDLKRRLQLTEKDLATQKQDYEKAITCYAASEKTLKQEVEQLKKELGVALTQLRHGCQAESDDETENDEVSLLARANNIPT